MRVALGWLLLAALLAHFGAHVAIAMGFAKAHDYRRALAAFFLPPLAPWLGWNAGMRRRVYAWGAALAVYAVGVAAA